jgi:hypothetical protein
MLNRRLSALVLLHCVVLAVAASCGGTTSKQVPSADNEGGEAGASDEPRGGRGGNSGRGGSSGSAIAGAPVAGSSGAAGAPSEGGTGGASPNAGEGGTSEAAGEAGAGGNADDEPPVDLGADCLPPPSAVKLTPAAAGLPVGGLQVWLRADRGVYATEQQRVCAWADQSGHHALFLASSGTRPLWAASALGTQPGIDFDTSTSLLSITGVLGIPAASGRTFIAVVQSVDTTGRFAAVQQGQSGTRGTYLAIDANTYNTAGSREGIYICNNSYDSALATSTSARVHVYTVSTMAPGLPVLSNIDYRVSGVTQTLTRNNGGLGNGNTEDFSGANFTLVGAGAHAIMAEALIYDRALSVEERTTVETALKARYAIQ